MKGPYSAGEVLAAKPEAFRGLLDDAEFFAAQRGARWFDNLIAQDIVRETLMMIRYGREAFKFWDCV